MSKRGRLLGVLLAAFFALLTAGRDAHADTWTILYYSGADNDLESATLEQWADLLRLNLNREEVTILLQMDRSPRGDAAGGFSNEPIGSVPNWAGTKRFVVDNHRLVELQDLGDPDATNPDTIADFIRWGVNLKRSQHIVLVVGDHGGAWTGAVSDDTRMGMEEATTSLDNIRAGIRLGIERAGVEGFTQFDLIAFDCCLMGNFEVAFALQPYGQYLVGAEQVQGGFSNSWLRALAANNAMSPETLARAMVDSFREWNLQDRGSSNVAGVYNLTRLPALTTALAALSATLHTDLMAGEESYRKIAAARLAADAFGSAPNRDLGQFLTDLRRRQVSDATNTATDTALGALREVIPYRQAGGAHRNAWGLSIYFPPEVLDEDYNAVTSLASLPWRTQFLPSYLDAVANDPTPPVMPMVVAPAAMGGRRNRSVSLATSGSDIGTVSLVLARREGGRDISAGFIPTDEGGGSEESSEGGAFNYEWDGRWPALSNGTTTTLVAMNSTDTYVEDGVRYARMEVPVQVTSPERSAARTVKLTFSLNLSTREGVFTGAYETRANGATGRVPVSDPSLVIRPFRQIVTAHDEFTREPGSVTLAGSSTLSLVAYQVPAGTYAFGVTVSDLSNNASTSTTVITITDDVGEAGSDGCSVGAPGGGTNKRRGLLLGAFAFTALVARRRVRRAHTRRAA